MRLKGVVSEGRVLKTRLSGLREYVFAMCVMLLCCLSQRSSLKAVSWQCTSVTRLWCDTDIFYKNNVCFDLPFFCSLEYIANNMLYLFRI